MFPIRSVMPSGMDYPPEDYRRRASCKTVDACVKEGLAVELLCKNCQRLRIIEAAPLERYARLKVLPLDLFVLSIFFRCTVCKAKLCAMRASLEEPNSPPIGPVTQAEFQAMRRKLRG